MIALIKLKTISKKIWLWAKKFWWALVLGLGFIVAILVWALSRNGAFVATMLDLLETKREAHAKELEAISEIHHKEVSDKNRRLEEHLKRKEQLEEEFKKRGEILDKEKEAELKRIVDEGYNDPEKLAKELAKAFGL